MNEIYKNLSEIKFKRVAIAALICGDVISFVVFHLRITSQRMFNLVGVVLKSDARFQGAYNSGEIIREIAPLIRNFSIMLFSLVFIYHVILYALYLRGSRACLTYIRFYAGTAMIGAGFLTFILIKQLDITALPILLATLTYAFFALAPKELQNIKTLESKT